MAQPQTTINDLQVQTALAKYAQQLRDKGPLLEAIGAYAVSQTQLNFRNSRSPYGVPWAPLKNRRGKPLVDIGHLRDSITYKAGSDSVSVSTGVIYAAVQNFGHTFDRAARSQHAYFNQAKDGSIGQRFVKKHKSNFAQRVTIGAHSVTIPARQFFPENELPPAWQTAIVNIIGKHMQQAN